MQFTHDKKEVKNFTNTKPAQTQNFNNNSNAPTLRIITLSGTESVTKNMTIYECGEDIIAVDCGMGFPDSTMPGVDIVLPDMTYLVENSHRLRALFITHGHEDHIGAIPYFLRDLKAPIYANKLVQGFIKERLKDKAFKGSAEGLSLHLITPETDEVTIGNFKISAFHVNHSVPSSMGFCINTPQGRVLHMADYKVDWTPVIDKPIDIAKISDLGKKGVLCLLTDCLGATTEGYSKSESTLNYTFHELFEEARGRQIFVTTISSNLSRMHQITAAAIEQGRKVALIGRSIDQSVGVARGLSYLPFDDDTFVTDEQAANMNQGDVVYIIAGCYGQQGSALDRVSRGEHDVINLNEDALVVFSADPNPPGVAEDVERLMDNLTLKGAEVIYSKIQDNLHVSGHGPKGDLIMIASIVKPKYFIPIGGTITKAKAYAKMVGELGVPEENVFALLEGESIVFKDNVADFGDSLPVKPVYVDGRGVGEVGPLVIQDRETLSTDGVFVVVIAMSKDKKTLATKPEVITRGFIYVKESRELINKSQDMINSFLNKNLDKLGDWNFIKGKLERDIDKFLYKETGRSPMIIIHSITV